MAVVPYFVIYYYIIDILFVLISIFYVIHILFTKCPIYVYKYLIFINRNIKWDTFLKNYNRKTPPNFLSGVRFLKNNIFGFITHSIYL